MTQANAYSPSFTRMRREGRAADVSRVALDDFEGRKGITGQPHAMTALCGGSCIRSTSRRLEQSGLEQVPGDPANAVLNVALAAAGEQLGAVRLGQAELVRRLLDRLTGPVLLIVSGETGAAAASTSGNREASRNESSFRQDLHPAGSFWHRLSESSPTSVVQPPLVPRLVTTEVKSSAYRRFLSMIATMMITKASRRRV